MYESSKLELASRRISVKKIIALLIFIDRLNLISFTQVKVAVRPYLFSLNTHLYFDFYSL